MTTYIVIDVDRPYLLTWQGGSCWPDFTWWKPLRIEPGIRTIQFQCDRVDWLPAWGSLAFTRIYPLDVHPDGTVDALDLAEVLGRWEPCDAARTAADVNLDGSVDAVDLALVLTGWGTDGRGP
jgi:hypothetical protein